MSLKVNTVVIGSGPGGYVAAIRLGQLGIDTLVIEKESVGGVCLNVGCIPSKALIHAGKSFYKACHEFSTIGIDVDKPRLNFPKMMAWKDGVVKKLTTGVAGLLKGNGVKLVKGEARFTGAHEIAVKTASGVETIIFKNCIIASGSTPTQIPSFPVDQKRILDSTGALSLTSLPKTLAVIGGGYIGLELGMAYAKMGTAVTVVEFFDSVLPSFDQDVVQVVARKLRKLGVTVLAKSKAKSFKSIDQHVHLDVEDKNGKVQTLVADYVIVAVGRTPNTKDLDLAKAGLSANDRGFIDVNDKLQTNVTHIYAIGDVVGNPMLAHKASKEGEVAAEVIAGHKSCLDLKQIPSVVFTDPEIAQSGLSENDAKGRDVTVSKFPFAAIGRSLTTNESDGFVKVISDAKTKELLGITVAGPNASDLISEASLAIEMGAFVEDIALTVHPHPTFGEIMMEAAKGNLGEAIHIINPKKRL